jgi:tetratricopeptide (TPR) repeat protein
MSDGAEIGLSNGIDLFNAEEYEKAEPILRRVVSLKPSSFDAWYTFGLALYQLRKFDESKDALKNAAFLEPYRADYTSHSGSS